MGLEKGATAMGLENGATEMGLEKGDDVSIEPNTEDFVSDMLK